jgi:hypothetical protein
MAWYTLTHKYMTTLCHGLIPPTHKYMTTLCHGMVPLTHKYSVRGYQAMVESGHVFVCEGVPSHDREWLCICVLGGTKP